MRRCGAASGARQQMLLRILPAPRDARVALGLPGRAGRCSRERGAVRWAAVAAGGSSASGFRAPLGQGGPGWGLGSPQSPGLPGRGAAGGAAAARWQCRSGGSPALRRRGGVGGSVLPWAAGARVAGVAGDAPPCGGGGKAGSGEEPARGLAQREEGVRLAVCPTQRILSAFLSRHLLLSGPLGFPSFTKKIKQNKIK